MTIPFLSVIVPAYDEEARISKSLPLLARFLEDKPYSWEVIVVDDGSTDATGAIVREWVADRSDFRLETIPHGGKGAAVRRGMLSARGERRFMCDADLAMPIERLDGFLRLIEEGSDVVIASRQMAGARRFGESSRRYLLGRVFNLMVQFLIVRGFSDTQCGFKCFRGDAAETLFGLQRTMGWTFDVEILYLARKKAMRVVELPIECHYDETSKMRTLPAALTVLRDILTLWWRTIFGVYAGDEDGAPSHRNGERT